MQLYKLTQEYQTIMHDFFDEETGKVNETSLVRINALKEDIEKKCISVAMMFKNLEAEKKAIEDAKKAMAAREATHKKSLEFLKGYLQENMSASEISEISCPQFIIRLVKNPYKVDDNVDMEILPEDYKKVKVEPDISKIRGDLLKGIDIPGARLVQGQSVRIK